MTTLFLRVALALAGSVLTATAVQAADPLSLVATGGVSYGGDDWQVARSRDGDPLYIHGGGRFEAGLGALWQAPNYPLAISGLVNYHVDSRAGANGHAKFTRVPLEAMLYYTGMEKLRFGVGLSYVLSPTVKATVDGQEHSIKFDNATGKAFEIGYELAPRWWGNLRLTSEKFTPKDAGAAQDASVSNLSINLSHLF